MTDKFAQEIAAAAADIGIDVTRYEGYSGRGMHGCTTDGVVGSQGDIIMAIAAVALQKGRDSGGCLNAENPADDDGDSFVDAMGQLSFDQLGRSNIIIY